MYETPQNNVWIRLNYPNQQVNTAANHLLGRVTQLRKFL